MEYYPPYSKSVESSGIFEYVSGESYGIVDGREVKNNRALNGDIVSVSDSRVVNVETRSDKLIVGILHLDTNQKYGFNKKGVPYIKFTSCCGKYPSFIVACKKRQNIAMYAAIRFNRWNTNDKRPVGQIEHYIGNVGNNASETDMLLFLNGIYPKKIKREFCREVSIGKDIDYRTFSIDPEGCRDIDDAFHFNGNLRGEDGVVEVGIHIANVARHLEWIKTNLYSTIYLENGQINMLDDLHTFQKCSLGNGERKLALSLILKYSRDGEKLLDYYFKESVLVNTSYAYADSNSDIGNLLEFTKKITGKMEMNSCEMVEYFMILYNSKVAEKLYNSRNKDETILRTHKINESSGSNGSNGSNSTIRDEVLDKFLERIEMQAAEYCIEPEDTSHQSLSLQYYTHATSPIRRFVDIINQNMIISQIDSSYSWNRENYGFEIGEVNKFGKCLRKFYNSYKKLKIIYSNTKYENIDAYIIKIKNNRVKIYIPSLDITCNFELVSSRIINAADIDYRVVEDSNGVSTEAHLNGASYLLYDKIKINITQLKYENIFSRKLKITLI